MEHGTYGTKGVADPNNSPGARYGSASWVDGSGNLWLFGGWGYAETGAFGGLGDLWKFNGTYWTWVSGAKTLNNVGVYGTKGEPNSANMPGARRGAVSWIDGGGNLWLFGGTGLDSTTWALLNDLWKFDGTKWTWVAGAKLGDKTGAYGTKGFGEPNNIPGSRQDAVVWVDSADNLWLFGGDGYATTGIEGKLNDLWKVRGLNNPKGDLNADGIVNFKDFAILAAHWKQNYLLTLGLTGGRAAGDEPTLREMTNIAGLWLSGK
jgi:hypothetical protein